MPSCSTAVNKRGVKITFTEENHEYSSVINGETIKYVSGTTFVDNFFPAFDPTGEITRRCAKREGITESQMRQRWKEKGAKSCIYGTKIHECMEDHLLGRKLRNKPSDDREKLVFKATDILSKKILERGDIVGVEKIIFDERLRIAGTIDLLIRSKKDGKLWILDHKTNESIDIENKYNNFALEPISHVADTNYWHYTEQLNLYQYLLRESGYIEPDEKVGMALFHITEKGIKIYNLEDRQYDIAKMIEYYKINGLREKIRN